jgi:hypothetical protein
MAETAGMSVSRCMGDWLTDTSEGAQFVMLKMEEARRAPKIVMREMQAFSRGLVEEVDSLADVMRKVPPLGFRSRGATKAVPAPSSNTGLNTPPKGPRKAKKL